MAQKDAEDISAVNQNDTNKKLENSASQNNTADSVDLSKRNSLKKL